MRGRYGPTTVAMLAASAVAAIGCSTSSAPARPTASPGAASSMRPPANTPTAEPRGACPRAPHPAVHRPARPWDLDGSGTSDLTLQHLGADEPSGDIGHVFALLDTRHGVPRCVVKLDGDSDEFGLTVASGDFDRDGYADLVVAEPFSREVFVVPGSALGPDPRHQRILTASRRGEFGRDLVVADFNRDGFADLAIGSPVLNDSPPYRSSIQVLWGGRAGLSMNRRYTISDKRDRELGWVLGAGDVDGDGYPDLVETIPLFNYPREPRPRLLVFGGGPNGPRRATRVPTRHTDGALAVGDVTGDGIDDVAVGDDCSGSPGQRRAVCRSRGGRVLLYVGSRTGLHRPVVVTRDSPGVPTHSAPHDLFGADVAIVPADGAQPGALAIRSGEPVDRHKYVGALYILRGAPDGVSRTGARRLVPGRSGVPGDPAATIGFGVGLRVRDLGGDHALDLLFVRGGRGRGRGPLMLVTSPATPAQRATVWLPAGSWSTAYP